MKSGYYKYKNYIIYYDSANNKVYDHGQRVAHHITDGVLPMLKPVKVMDVNKVIEILNKNPLYSEGLYR